MKTIDKFLNNITMYRLVLYYLICLLVIAFFFSFLGILPFNPFSLAFSALFLILISWSVNSAFSIVFQAQTNLESVYISALILALIVTPIKTVNDLPFLGWAAIWTVSSKYILAINKKHFFNPVAFAVALTAVTLNHSANWWIGTSSLLPFVILGGILIVRKIQRSALVESYLVSSMAAILFFSLIKGENLVIMAQKALTDTPLLFFAFIMLTEPQTTPPTRKLQIYYGALVGFLFAPQVHLGNIYSTPELSLLIGNIFSYFVSPKIKLILRLKEKIQTAPETFDFVFSLNNKFSFIPGQYLEWTLAHNHPDSRGNRRFFTLASSPTEDNIRIGVKFYKIGSSFKNALLSLNDNSEIAASQLSGDFILPKDKNLKLVFMAGGIGITPFRSMIKYLLDMGQNRSVALFYTNKTTSEIIYDDLLKEAQEKLGIKIIYTLTDRNNIPLRWQGKAGRIDETMIKEEVPDYSERQFFLSGPHSMVASFEEILKNLGVSKKQIKIDYFPGFA